MPKSAKISLSRRCLEIGAINSNEINPRDFASSHVDPPGDVLKPDIDLQEDFNMVEEQQKDEEIGKLKNRINKGTATKAEQTHYFETEDGLLYYLSQPDSENFDFTFLKTWKTPSSSSTTISLDIWHWTRPMT